MHAKPFVIIARTGDLYHLAVLATDMVSNTTPAFAHVEVYTQSTRRQRRAWALRGRPAELLYLSLTGHEYGADPATANPYAARAARVILATLAEPGFYMASLVVKHSGEFIQPGLGQPALIRQPAERIPL